MRLIKVVLAIIAVLLFSIFVTQNYSSVNVYLLNYTFTLPIFLLVLFSAFIGFLIPSLYLSTKLYSKTKKLERINKAMELLYRGYPSSASSISGSLAKSWETAGIIYMQSQFATNNYSIELDKLEKSKGLVEAYVGDYLLKKGNIELAKGYLNAAINKDEDNLIALKAYRDFCFLESKIEESVKYQEKIVQKSERWDRENQKAILAELLCIYADQKSDLNERKAILERAYNTYKTPFVYFHYLSYFLEMDDIKSAEKIVDRIFKENFQNEVFLMLSEKEILLTKLLDVIEQNKNLIVPEVLAKIYIKLNMISKLQEIDSNLKEPLNTIVKMHMSHSKEAKACKEVLLELYKPWECVCGASYNFYMPICKKCFRWGEISLRKVNLTNALD